MDTSETYIKMRLAAIPDLGMGEPPEAVDEDIITGGDTYLEQTEDIFIDAKGDFYYSDEEVACQLERQDQLQEMVQHEDLLNGIYWWTRDKGCVDWQTAYSKQFTSMEQLWLAFVMHEKYQKVWNGETWVKEASS